MASQHVRRIEKTSESISSIKDPIARLDAARQARAAFEQLELEQVRRLRAEGTPWSRIAAVYGLTKQGAQQRFRDKIDTAKG